MACEKNRLRMRADGLTAQRVCVAYVQPATSYLACTTVTMFCKGLCCKKQEWCEAKEGEATKGGRGQEGVLSNKAISIEIITTRGCRSVHM